jgi:hypothetical protein
MCQTEGGIMNPVAASASSIEAVNNILQTANQASIEAAEKLMKVSVEMAVGAECGKGGAIDCSA